LLENCRIDVMSKGLKNFNCQGTVYFVIKCLVYWHVGGSLLCCPSKKLFSLTFLSPFGHRTAIEEQPHSVGMTSFFSRFFSNWKTIKRVVGIPKSQIIWFLLLSQREVIRSRPKEKSKYFCHYNKAGGAKIDKHTIKAPLYQLFYKFDPRLPKKITDDSQPVCL